MLFIRQSYGYRLAWEKTRIFNGVRCMSAKFCNFAYDNGIYFSMNKWQKIVGVTIISALIIAHIWALTDYLFVAELAETYCAEMGQDLFFDCIYNFKEHFWCYNVLAMFDIIFIIRLFAALWRKGSKE